MARHSQTASSPRTARALSRDGGFTLLEVLISLAIASSLIVLLMNALVVQSRTQARLSDLDHRVMDVESQRQRFEAVLRGVVAPSIAGSAECFGDSVRFACETVTALGAPGVQPFELALRSADDGGIELVYRERDGDEQPIARWAAAQRVSFSYLHRNGEWRAVYDPAIPALEALGTGPEARAFRSAVPRGVSVTIEEGGRTYAWSAPIGHWRRIQMADG